MTIARRIRTRRRALTLSQERLGNLVGVGQTTVAAWESGRSTPKPQMIEKLASVLGVPKEWLLYGEERAKPRQVKLRGYVGAGDLVTMLPDDVVDWVTAPPDEEVETEAFEVRGNSMWPVYRHGDIIYYEKDRLANPADCIGEECVVELEDGRMYVKRILRGSRPNVYTLASWNGPEMHDQVIITCAPVRWVKRSHRK